MFLFDRDQLERRIEAGELAPWKERRYRTFRETMVDEVPPFPCHFAVDAQEEGLFRYVFPESATDESELAGIATALAEYLDSYDAIGEITSFVMLFEPPDGEPSAGEYKRRFWNVLEFLNRNDPEPWPATVPTDPDHPKWQFCFAGEPVFLVARAPFYEARKSRHTPHGLEITVQPWAVFDGLTGLDDEGQEARTVIRDRLERYDDIEMHPDSGDLVDPRTKEWKQYMLPETNAESVVRCPLSERER